MRARDVYFEANENPTGVIKTLIVETIISYLTFTRTLRSARSLARGERAQRALARAYSRAAAMSELGALKSADCLSHEIDVGFSKIPLLQHGVHHDARRRVLCFCGGQAR